MEIKREAHGERRSGYLLQIQFHRGEKFAMYLEEDGQWALEFLCEERSRAEIMFVQVMKGELSPLHLADFCQDEKGKTEIFG